MRKIEAVLEGNQRQIVLLGERLRADEETGLGRWQAVEGRVKQLGSLKSRVLQLERNEQAQNDFVEAQVSLLRDEVGLFKQWAEGVARHGQSEGERRLQGRSQEPGREDSERPRQGSEGGRASGRLADDCGGVARKDRSGQSQSAKDSRQRAVGKRPGRPRRETAFCGPARLGAR